ncbi:ABC transporter substrate-binding protein [Streptacidiphilus sp. N1-12]|uniref:ABC transporter substrate-binding protein n=2 Tax=Streptacidiphilus alkalitolerans TaxID=3342712 RepID=A0ABV6V2F6_9ACTN
MSAAKRLGALGSVGLLAMTAACGSSASGGVAGVPKTTMNMGTVSAYTSLDPAGAYDAGSWMVFYNVYQGLLTYLPGSTVPTPDAAQSCNFVGTDYMTYHCSLIKGLTFSNGDPLDAAAVKYSIDRVLTIGSETLPDKQPADNGSGVSVLLSTLKSVEANGSTDVTFHLKTADATFPDRLASGVGEIVDPKAYSATRVLPGVSGAVVGSGVYKIDSVQTKKDDTGAEVPTSVKLSLNPNYKGAYSKTKPTNSGVTLSYYDSPADIRAALDSGKIDLNANSDLASKDIVSLEGAQQLGKGLQVVEGAGSNTRMMVLNTKLAPFDNLAVRQAIAKLIDRDAIAATYQHTVTPLYSVIPQGIGDQTTPFEASPYDVKPLKAAVVRQSLKGVSLPISFNLTYAANSVGGNAEAAQIKKTLEASGLFKVNLTSVATLGKMIPLWAGHKLPASLTGWQPDYPDPDDYVSPFLGVNNTFGNGYAPAKIMKDLTPLSLKQPNRADDSTANTFATIQKQFAYDAAYIPLWQNKQYIVTQSDVTGVPLTLDLAAIMRFWMIGKS